MCASSCFWYLDTFKTNLGLLYNMLDRLRCFVSLRDFAYVGCGKLMLLTTESLNRVFLLLTEEKTESPASTQEYVVVILGMARKPMVQKCLTAIRTSYLLNKGEHHQREKRILNQRYSLFHRL